MASIAGLVVAIVLMTGSHTATLVYSVPFIGLATLGGMLIFPSAVRGIRRFMIVAAISAMAVGVNGWFLAPLLANRHAIRLQPLFNLVWRAFDEYEVIFNLQLVNPYAWSTPQLYVQAPVIPMAVSAAIILAGMALHQNARLAVIGIALHVAFFVMVDLITQMRLWDWLPAEARVLQMRYRLNTYLLACIVGLVTLAAVYVGQVARQHRLPGRVAGGLLVLAVLAQFGYGQYQVWTAGTYGPADAQLADLSRLPRTWYERFDYGFVAPPELGDQLLLPLEAVAGAAESTTLWATIPSHYPGGRLAILNVLYSPFIAVEPAGLLVGRSGYYAVVQLPNDRAVDRISISYRQTPAVVLGAAISVVSLLGVTAAMALAPLSRIRLVLPSAAAGRGRLGRERALGSA